MLGRITFGQHPPKLFTRVPENVPDGTVWEDPDGEWIPGKIRRNVPREELERVIFETKGGALNLLPQLGLRGLLKVGGLEAFSKAVDDLGRERSLKELVKRIFRDPFQNYWPIAVNGYWAHRHDAVHIQVSKLKPIRMGKTENVNGIDGHSYKVVPLFHPDKPDFKAKYNGLLDEYRVAIHVFLLDPSLFNLLRLLHYTTRFKKLVPDPIKAIRAHKQSMIGAGLKPKI